MSAVTAWASANAFAAASLCLLAVFGAILAGFWAVPACWRAWRDLGPAGDPEVHHDGRVQPATAAPAVTLPPAVAAPLWPAPPAVDPYAGYLAFAGPAGTLRAAPPQGRAEDLAPEAGSPVPAGPAAAAGAIPPSAPPPPVTPDVPGPASAPPPGDAPGPAGLPEGDTPPWPPQETGCPGDLSPLAKATAAIAEVRGMDPADYAAHLEAATAWEDRGPLWDLLSDETMARGIPVAALKAAVDKYGKQQQGAVA